MRIVFLFLSICLLLMIIWTITMYCSSGRQIRTEDKVHNDQDVHTSSTTNTTVVISSATDNCESCGDCIGDDCNSKVDVGNMTLYGQSSDGPCWKQIGNTIQGRSRRAKNGFSVTINADATIVAMSSIYSDNRTGHVRVFHRDPISHTYIQIGDDLTGKDEKDRFGHCIQLNADGTRIVVGAIDDTYDYGGDTAGYVQVFQRLEHGSSWEQIGSDMVGEGAQDRFGYSVSINAEGNIIAVGGVFNNNFRGHVRVFQYVDAVSDWIQMGTDIDGHLFFEFFGKSIAMSTSGLRIVIGANGTENGYAKVFEFDTMTSDWVQLGSTLIGEHVDDRFGCSVDMNEDGSLICVGAIGNDDVAESTGHVRVFQLFNGDWQQLGEDIDGKEQRDRLGYCLSMNGKGDTVAIGIPYSIENAGTVRIYQFIDQSWAQVGNTLVGRTQGDNFGHSLSLDYTGTYLLVGSIGFDEI